MALSEDTKAKVEALGKNQRGVLDALARSGQYPGGWTWGSHSQTSKICQSLVKRGLATARVVQGASPSRDYTIWEAIPEIREDAHAQDRERSQRMAAVRAEANAEADRRRLEREARQAAIAILITRHADEFRALVEDQQAERGVAS